MYVKDERVVPCEVQELSYPQVRVRLAQNMLTTIKFFRGLYPQQLAQMARLVQVSSKFRNGIYHREGIEVGSTCKDVYDSSLYGMTRRHGNDSPFEPCDRQFLWLGGSGDEAKTGEQEGKGGKRGGGASVHAVRLIGLMRS